MKDKFSLYQADGFWGIIEDASDEKQTSVKSYIGPDLIVKRLNEQADQIDQLKQQLVETEQKFLEFQEDSIRNEQTYVIELAEKDKEIERLKNLFKLNNEVVINQGKEIFDLRVQVLQQKQNQTQLAIQELEKVKAKARDVSGALALCEVEVQIDQQIKELKGE